MPHDAATMRHANTSCLIIQYLLAYVSARTVLWVFLEYASPEIETPEHEFLEKKKTAVDSKFPKESSLHLPTLCIFKFRCPSSHILSERGGEIF
jgi:hypothetical protein